ncbi:MAG: NUMOD4 motif-containing HNH endonuclease [Bacteroidetes bacterium]|nr:NUMOD4 motif-containing HNH endonuclease [Bacteroidota bacterium]
MPSSETEWCPIPGFSFYEASNDGQIRSRRSGRWRLLHPWVDKQGYERVSLRGDEVPERDYYVHRIICLTFDGDPPYTSSVARHINDIRTDNRASNIAWGSQADNSHDRTRNRMTAAGRGAVVALKERTIRAVHALLSHEDAGVRSVARDIMREVRQHQGE